MKLFMMLIVLLMVAGCSSKEATITFNCKTIEPLPKIDKVNIKLNEDGSLGPINTQKVILLNKKLRIVEDYYFEETNRIKQN